MDGASTCKSNITLSTKTDEKENSGNIPLDNHRHGTKRKRHFDNFCLLCTE